MIDQARKDTAKLVKDWAISIGFTHAQISVRAGAGKAGYIQLHVRHQPTPRGDSRAPLVYDKLIPKDICRRMLEVIYPNATWLTDQYSAGNIHQHMATMVASEWNTFLEKEAARA